MLVPERFRQSHPDLRASFFAAPIARPMGAGRDLYGLKKDGCEFPIEIGLTPIETEDGIVVLSAIIDISARKRSEARFRQVIELAPSAMVMIGPAGRIEMVNVQSEALFGYPRNELLGQPIEILIPQRFRNHHPDLRTAYFGRPISRPMGAGRDLYGLKKDGSEFPIEIGLNPIETEEGTVVLSAIVDISERKQNEERLQALIAARTAELQQQVTERRKVEDALRQSQKMEAIGQLTGGIAHDFNNLLQGILGSLTLLKRKISRGMYADADRFIENAEASANRAAGLTHALLAFSRRQPLDPKTVDINELIHGMADLLRGTIGETIQVGLALSTNLWATRCDVNQLHSAILNLAINARDAMPQGGTLTIETVNIQLDSAATASAVIAPGDYVCMSISDNGIGMSSDIVAKAYEPFFTTKLLGQGTGLGLSMVYGFVRQSGGYTTIYSEVGRGTTVKLYLPACDQAKAHRTNGCQSDDVPPTRQGQVVLVVEDDTTVRGQIVEVLRDLGYDALEAADGLSGLEILRSPQRIDLLVTDMGLPALNGRQVADGGREVRPSLKVLFMTGYAENAAVSGGFMQPGMKLLTKPFKLEVLAMRIREMIGA